MKIFKDVFSNDEVASDSFPIKTVDCVYEVEGKLVIEDNSAADKFIGANDVETEGTEKEVYEDAVKVINVVHASKLTKTTYDKKSYMAHIKAYMKRLKTYLEENNPARVAPFQSEAQAFVKKILDNFNKYEFYVGESMDFEAMTILMFYKDGDELTPYFYIWKDGIIEEKV
jgi:hypothetical protein